MKYTIKSIISNVAVVSLITASLAAQTNNSQKLHDLPTFVVENSSLPIATKAPAPRVRGGLLGTEITMLFSISDQGRPERVRLKGGTLDGDKSDLAAAMELSIRLWRFEPARNELGAPIAVNVSLPVKVVREDKTAKAIAQVDMGKLELIRRIN